MDRTLKITKAENGYVITWMEDGEEYMGVLGWICHLLGVRPWRAVTEREVFEEPDTETGELEAVQNLLWFVMEHFAVYGSDHDRYRLQVEIVDQYRDEDDKIGDQSESKGE